ncbi:hypothetical protein [Bradyrhizobium sp. NP1]|uniref:hypothetical protein n=1 Tax=Bradyrhizobium sp. NP1 TaxID=3049772 RepID=UPI0025A59A7F|nr:hypothetical protein [Bradyrhizobium sp. NP1]WJR75166.1 hypothetical protein QOU61_20350 [Bradyrhizobium sp. NP1]
MHRVIHLIARLLWITMQETLDPLSGRVLDLAVRIGVAFIVIAIAYIVVRHMPGVHLSGV